MSKDSKILTFTQRQKILLCCCQPMPCPLSLHKETQVALSDSNNQITQTNKRKTTSVHLSLKTLFFLYNRMCFCPVPDSQSLPCNWISLWGNGSVPQSLCCRCFLLLKATAPLSSLPTKTVLHFCQMVRTHDVTQSNFWLLIALGWLFLSLSVTSPDTSYLLELSSLACHCRG